MSDYTTAEVDQAIERAESGSEFPWWDELPSPAIIAKYVTLNLRDEDVPVEVVTNCDGQGEDVYSVIKVGDQLFRKRGQFSSHWGTEWNGLFEEVESYKELVTFYKRKGTA